MEVARVDELIFLKQDEGNSQVVLDVTGGDLSSWQFIPVSGATTSVLFEIFTSDTLSIPAGKTAIASYTSGGNEMTADLSTRGHRYHIGKVTTNGPSGSMARIIAVCKRTNLPSGATETGA